MAIILPLTIGTVALIIGFGSILTVCIISEIKRKRAERQGRCLGVIPGVDIYRIFPRRTESWDKG